MGLSQRTLGPPEENFLRMPVSRQTPSLWGPSHCGQSSALLKEPLSRIPKTSGRGRTSLSRVRIPFLRCLLNSDINPDKDLGTVITIDAAEGKMNVTTKTRTSRF